MVAAAAPLALTVPPPSSPRRMALPVMVPPPVNWTFSVYCWPSLVKPEVMLTVPPLITSGWEKPRLYDPASSSVAPELTVRVPPLPKPPELLYAMPVAASLRVPALTVRFIGLPVALVVRVRVPVPLLVRPPLAGAAAMALVRVMALPLESIPAPPPRTLTESAATKSAESMAAWRVPPLRLTVDTTAVTYSLILPVLRVPPLRLRVPVVVLVAPPPPMTVYKPPLPVTVNVPEFRLTVSVLLVASPMIRRAAVRLPPPSDRVPDDPLPLVPSTMSVAVSTPAFAMRVPLPPVAPMLIDP